MSGRLTDEDEEDLLIAAHTVEPIHQVGAALLGVVDRILADRLATAEAENAALRARLDEVRVIHHEESTDPTRCWHDGLDWPCPTLRAVLGAAADEATGGEWRVSTQQGKPCSAKIRHLNKSSAKATIRRMKGREGKIRAYRCLTCGFWHVGHQPGLINRGEMDRRDWKAKRT